MTRAPEGARGDARSTGLAAGSNSLTAETGPQPLSDAEVDLALRVNVALAELDGSEVLPNLPLDPRMGRWRRVGRRGRWAHFDVDLRRLADELGVQ